MNILSRLIVAAALTLMSTHVVAQTPLPTDPAARQRYMDALNRFGDCIKPIGDHWYNSMEQAAILYPRFGIAWAAQKNAIEAAVARGDTAASEKAHEQFLDRMLRTAEPEAVEFYNLMDVQRKQAMARCGPMPKVSP
jgi:hypothetical protein